MSDQNNESSGSKTDLDTQTLTSTGVRSDLLRLKSSNTSESLNLQKEFLLKDAIQLPQLDDAQKEQILNSQVSYANVASMNWALVDDDEEIPLPNPGFVVSRKTIKIPQFDQSWGDFARFIGRLIEMYQVPTDEVEACRAIVPIFSGAIEDDAVKESVLYLTGFSKLFGKTWNVSDKNDTSPLGKGFREAGNRLMLALNYKEHSAVAGKFFKRTNDLNGHLITLCQATDQSQLVENFLDELVKRRAAKIVTQKKRSNAEHFWTPKITSLVIPQLPSQKVEVRIPVLDKAGRPKKGQFETKIEHVPVIWSFTKNQKLYLHHEEELKASQWNRETAVSSWVVPEHDFISFADEAKIAYELSQFLISVVSPIKGDIRHRKNKIYSAYVAAYPEKDKAAEKFGDYTRKYLDQMTEGDFIYRLLELVPVKIHSCWEQILQSARS